MHLAFVRQLFLAFVSAMPRTNIIFPQTLPMSVVVEVGGGVAYLSIAWAPFGRCWPTVPYAGIKGGDVFCGRRESVQGYDPLGDPARGSLP